MCRSIKLLIKARLNNLNFSMLRSITLSILLFSNLLDARTKREEAKIKAAQDAVSSLTYEIQQ